MYANVHIDDDGGTIEIRAVNSDLQSWAKRPGAAWPCSTLADCERGIVATLDIDSGDLVNLAPLTPSPRIGETLENVAGDELTAFLDDALEDAAKLLLEARKVKQ